MASSVSSMVGIDRYVRHVFVNTGPASSWKPKLDEDENLKPFLEKLKKSLKSRESAFGGPVKITGVEEPAGPSAASPGRRDVFVFPDAVVYSLGEADTEAFAVELAGGPSSSGLSKRALATKNYVFVCCHGTRDSRCGNAGPPLVEELRRRAAAKGLSEGAAGGMAVRACSHIGGHKFAGNAVLYPSGHWLGNLHHGSGEAVDAVVAFAAAQAAAGGALPAGLRGLWRGRMGTGEEEQKATLEEWKRGCAAAAAGPAGGGEAAPTGIAAKVLGFFASLSG